MATRTRKRLVAFFEIRDSEGGVLKEPTPWAEHLAELSKEAMKERMHPVHSIPHWGQVYTYKGTDHLVLARKRDAMSSFDTNTGEIIDSDSDSGRPWVEISVIHFLPGTNYLGFVLGSNASPQVSTLAAWINAHQLFGEEITIEPVMGLDVLGKLRGASEASIVKVKYTSDQLAQVKASSGLYDASRTISNGVDEVSVEMIFKIEGGIRGSSAESRAKLLGFLKSLLGGGDVSKAAAKIISYDAEGHRHSEDVDFVKHRLAKRMEVALTDQEGNPVRVSSAIDAIYKAAWSFERDLYQR